MIAIGEDLRTGEHTDLVLRPSRATGFEHGFASFSHFLPDGKGWLAAVEQGVWDRLIPPGGAPRQVFEDQYLCSAGQLAEIMTGRDRMIGDLRPYGLRAVGLAPTLACHPYDVCTALILTELGGVFEDPFGGPVDVALDTTSPVAYMAYANEDLAAAGASGPERGADPRGGDALTRPTGQPSVASFAIASSSTCRCLQNANRTSDRPASES